MEIEEKRCTKCGILKTINEFHIHKITKDGKAHECKECCKKYAEEHKEEKVEYNKKYYEDHKEEIVEYQRKRRKEQGKTTMYENKSCSSYLGIVIGERLCRHLFKDVEMMPNGFPDYDIICNKGKKINVKAACITSNDGNYPRWVFFINYNKIADHFILVAFDNRTDLNLLHIWMIPGNELNHQGKASISTSTIHKWDKWKMDMSNAQACCNLMKKGDKQQ